MQEKIYFWFTPLSKKISFYKLILVPPHFWLVPPHIISSSDGNATIPHLKCRETKSTNLSLANVAVQTSHSNEKADLSQNYCIRVVPPLAVLAKTCISRCKSAPLGFRFLCEVANEDMCPECGGFNAKFSRNDGVEPKPKTSVAYTPLFDMPPAEPDPMKTAMMHARYLASLIGQVATVLTYYQQLYQVAVNIAWKNTSDFFFICGQTRRDHRRSQDF